MSEALFPPDFHIATRVAKKVAPACMKLFRFLMCPILSASRHSNKSNTTRVSVLGRPLSVFAGRCQLWASFEGRATLNGWFDFLLLCFPQAIFRKGVPWFQNSTQLFSGTLCPLYGELTWGYNELTLIQVLCLGMILNSAFGIIVLAESFSSIFNGCNWEVRPRRTASPAAGRRC